MQSVFCAPARYVQGRNATLNLGKEIQFLGLGKRATILAGKAAVKHLSESWKDALEGEKIKFVVTEFKGECSRIEIDRVKDVLSSISRT